MELLCSAVREMVAKKEYQSCVEQICQAIGDNPHAPEPHNLMGVVMEKVGDHAGAMKHFRAALALDPTYRPATHNLYTYGTFFSSGRSAFDESDLPDIPESTVEIVYDERGIGRVVSKTGIEYDKYGIGHVVRR